MADEIAGFAVGLSERLRYPIKAAFRQALEAGVRYGYMTRNPAKLARPNPMPAPREIRVYTAAELKAVTDELGTVESSAVTFAAATGLRPSEWASIERSDVDKGPPSGPRAGNQDAPLSARGAAHISGAHRA